MTDPDRLLKLEERLSGPFEALCDQRGYTPEEVADALLRLACARVLAVKAHADTEEEIREAVKTIHGIARS